ncbi:DUF1367 family protein [Salmonella enterica]|nr:DUF1367 family protein [Salmonella enterica]EBP8956127.1 DUF1367 family protein [Salmonella enterica subsp. enterica]ECZ8176530.1 DUF1367 family protein [Salmonella enterica]ECZ8218597.1 DUF1367 family protein [Salmonella enterica]EDH2276970.1 DUF1367 family protein [Salmonella enterica]
MAHLQLVKQTSSGLLLPATPESGDFLRSVKIGEWIHADFKRVRNYAFHKRFFKLLQLGFDYWMPTGGTVTSREQKLISGFVNFLCDSAGQEYTPALNEAAEQYLHNVATLRTGDVALLKSFDAFREWVTEPQKAGIASFCPYNIGPGKCFPSTFYRKLNAGDRKGACAEIRRWVYDGGKDCHNRENQCYGQVIRRDQESALTCWGIDQ